MSLWRIATDAPLYEADDLTGKGAELSGGRWNRKGSPVVYVSTTRALACLESVVHLADSALPLNRYLVELVVPQDEWRRALEVDAKNLVGWDAEPAGKASLDWGTNWLASALSVLARVPSIIVPEEFNVLVNPLHQDASKIRARKVRKWFYDARLKKQ